MTIVEFLKANKNKYPSKDLLISQAIKTLNVSRDAVTKAYKKVFTTNPTIGITEKDLRAKYDNMFKLKEGVKALKKGIFLRDQEMREICKIPPAVWRGYSEHQEFEKYKYKPNSKETYWSTPDSVARMREEIYG